MRVIVDRSKCRKCGLCAAVCPEIFEIGRDHVARAKHFEVPPVGDLQEYCIYAAMDCPGGAIDVTPWPPSPQTGNGLLEDLSTEIHLLRCRCS